MAQRLGLSRTLHRSKGEDCAEDRTFLHLLTWPRGFCLMAAPGCLQEIWVSLGEEFGETAPTTRARGRGGAKLGALTFMVGQLL